MNGEHINIRDLIVAKSDQLNADDLISGPITVQLTSISVKRGEQPVTIGISGGHQPWKPCKTTLRVLVFAWGDDYPNWVGRSITLYLDPEVKWGGVKVGGIRIAAMSHIPKRIELSLAETKGKKVTHRIEVLKATSPQSAEHMGLDAFQKWCGWARSNGWTREQIAELLGCKSADVPPEKRAELVERLKTPPVAAPPMTPEEAAADRAREET
jgi:hypothetical protein